MTSRPDALLPFPDSTEVTSAGLAVGGCALTEIAAEFGTPLYLYDEQSIRTRARSVVEAVSAGAVGSRAAFALKSLSTLRARVRIDCSS